MIRSRSSNAVVPSAVELCSGVDALYLSAQGVAPPALLADLGAVRLAAEAADLPVDFHLGGYLVKVQPRGWQKYRYCVTHELAMIRHYDQ